MDYTKELTHLSLCTGYEGIGRGLRRIFPNVREVAYVEIEAFAIANLVAKMEKGYLYATPIYTDLKTFPYKEFYGKVDFLSAGFPCQPFSAAGRRASTEDPRHLYPYIAKGISECRPTYVVLENVQGLSQAKQPMASRYSSMSSEIWKKEVIEHRGEYSQRVKLALHTSGRECLSWPTATSSDGEGGRIETILNKGGFKSKRKTSGQVRGAKLRDAVETYENWPTADATIVSDGIPWEIAGKQLEERRARVKIAVAEGKTKAGSGRSVNLAMAVQRELAWATPTTQDTIEHKDMKLNEKGRRLTKDGKDSHSVGLGDQVKIEKGEKSWTERKELSADYKETTWATPISRDWKDTGDIKNWESTENYQMSLPKQAGLLDQEKSSTNGKSQESPSVLNPNWVEQLMGLPVGWTQLPTEWTD